MSFFVAAAGLIGKLAISVGSRSLGEKLKDVKTQRRMGRLVDDAVDRIVEQTEEYLRAENVSDARKEILIAALCAKLEPLAEDPQRFFAGDLDGTLIFKQCHPNGELPQEIREEKLGQFYTVLFPQIAHFLAGSRVALAQWQAEGFREEFKRLSQLAEEIRAMNAKVADLPTGVERVISGKAEQESEILLREISQTILNSLLLRLDLSPLRAERALHGSLGDHFVVPAIREKRENAEPIGEERVLLNALAAPGARRVVHGGAGIGKTTCSLWLQSRFLQANQSRLAVVLRLREITDIEKRSLLDLLRDRAGTHLRDALTDAVLRKWHSAGRMVIILDGFDEIPEERRDAVEKWVKDLAVVAKKTALLVTSRPIQTGHLESLKRPWQQWDLLPFNEPRIIEFIERWHRYLPEGELSAAERKVDAATLAATFFSDPSLRPLADTPLMLGTLLFVHHRDKQLPSGRVDLYERYIAAMLGLRDSGLGIEARATKLTDKEKRRVLSHIALHFHLQSINEVNDDAMCRLVAEALSEFKLDEDVQRLLAALRERTGLLQGPGTWSFTHKTIGEFLVAELVCDGTYHLLDRRRLDRKELWSHRHEDTWTAVLFFWAGKTSPRELEEFVDELLGEQTLEGTLLALSLLHDQGDRLTYEMQRQIAVRMVNNALPVPRSYSGWCRCIPPVVPKIIDCSDYEGPGFELRSLSRVASQHALMMLYVKGVLRPQDVLRCHETWRAPLSIAAIWALSEKGYHITQELRSSLNHLATYRLALYCFSYSGLRSNDDVDDERVALAEWLNVFPEGNTWVALLLCGRILHVRRRVGDIAASNLERQVGPLLWEWRNHEVDKDWLKGSDVCVGWFKGSLDVLAETLRSIRKDGAAVWGVTPDQHRDLVAWCSSMIARRAELKRAAK